MVTPSTMSVLQSYLAAVVLVALSGASGASPIPVTIYSMSGCPCTSFLPSPRTLSFVVFFHTHASISTEESNSPLPRPTAGSAQYAWNFNETVWSDPELRAAISFEQPFAATHTLNHTVCFHGGKECRFETWLLCAQDQGIDKVHGKTRRGGTHRTCSLASLFNPGRSTAVRV